MCFNEATIGNWYSKEITGIIYHSKQRLCTDCEGAVDSVQCKEYRIFSLTKTFERAVCLCSNKYSFIVIIKRCVYSVMP